MNHSEKAGKHCLVLPQLLEHTHFSDSDSSRDVFRAPASLTPQLAALSPTQEPPLLAPLTANTKGLTFVSPLKFKSTGTRTASTVSLPLRPLLLPDKN